MTDLQDALCRFFAALHHLLAAGAARQPEAASVAAVERFAALIRTVRIEAAPSDPSDPGSAPFGLPVCRFWAGALDGAAGAGLTDLAAGLRALGPALRWTQNPNYRRRPPDPRFLRQYGYAVIAGPSSGGGPGDAADHALVEDDRLAVGVLLLGPETHYPLHHHPAAEIYGVMSGTAEWFRGDGPWRPEPPGAIIYHGPQLPHATRTGAAPLLAVYVWQGDLMTRARLATSAETTHPAAPGRTEAVRRSGFEAEAGAGGVLYTR